MGSIEEIRATRDKLWSEYQSEIEAARRKAVESRAHRDNARVLLVKYNGLGNVLDSMFAVPVPVQAGGVA